MYIKHDGVGGFVWGCACGIVIYIIVIWFV